MESTESAEQQDARRTIRHLETEVHLLKEGLKQAERIRLLHSKTAQQLKDALAKQREAEAALRESEEKFRAVTESAAEAVILLDNDGKIAYWNRSAEAILGYPAQAVMGRPVGDVLVPARHREAHRAGVEQFRTTGEGLLVGQTVEVEAVRSDGREIPVDMAITAIKLKGAWHAIGTLRDASVRKREEADAARLNEAATMRYLLEGITHGLKNPLFILTGRLQLLHSKLTQPECVDLKADVEKIEGAVQRLSATLDHFTMFTVAPTEQPEPCRVDDTLREAAAFLADRLNQGRLTLVERLATDLPPVTADSRQFRQMFLTLMLYAVEAMRANRRGTLTVAAGWREGGEGGEGGERGGGWIEVRIAHDGESVPPEKLATLFEPFSALSGSNGGLGLWPVRMTAMALKGTVTCESNPGQGATFIVRLPVAGMATRGEGATR